MGIKILAVIPARGGSKGIKNKNLKKIGNLTLFEHAIIQAKSSRYINQIAVSTDSKKIQKLAKGHGVWCDVLRPQKISKDNSITSEAILHVIKNISGKFDYVVELHPTHIFRPNNLIDKAIKKITKNKSFDSLFSIIKISSTAHPDYVIKKNRNNKISFNRSPSIFNRHFLRKYYMSTGVIIISKVQSLLNSKKMCNGNCLGYEIKDYMTRSNIDNIYDYELAKILWKSYGNLNKYYLTKSKVKI